MNSQQQSPVFLLLHAAELCLPMWFDAPVPINANQQQQNRRTRCLSVVSTHYRQQQQQQPCLATCF
jgi:hypothetical protein